ncbi:intermembrane phospholipid transport protein YdbH family protein [Henriciella litoralis]|uniref:intermembrane phospholipid transport protein YdbH family protein n=1 Tax=Henriciella litoralis TaxID=568102 RepID=UPI00146F7359|nr:YdbH domain-containing protein [Henriciella litoralis]
MSRHPWLTGIGLVLLLLLFTLLLLWVFRLSLTETIAKRWCRSQALECEIEATDLSLSGTTIDAIRLTNETGQIPFEAERLTVELSWKGFLKPVVERVEINRPVIRLSYTEDGKISVGGLEDLAPGGSSETPQAMPEIVVRDARIEAQTPAGTVVATGRFEGKLPYKATLHARIEPVDLSSEQGSLSLTEGRVDLSLSGFRLQGSARLQLKEAVFEGLEARNITLDASMADTLLPTVEWSASIDTLSAPDLALEDTHASGRAGIVAGEVDEGAPLLARLRRLSAEANSASVRWQDFTAQTASLTLETKRNGKDQFEGDFAARLTDFQHPDLSASELTLSGQGSASEDLSTINLTGEAVANGATVEADTRRRILDSIAPAAPFEAHGKALRSGLSAALSDFATGSGYTFSLANGSDWSLRTTRKLSATAANGAVFALTPHETQPALNVSGDIIDVAGVLTLHGPGLPTLAADVSDLLVTDEGIRLKAGGFSIDPWTASGLTLGANLSELDFDSTSGDAHVQGLGEIRINGRLFGMDMKNARLFGGLEAISGDALRVQSYSTRCIGLDTKGIDAAGDLAIGAMQLQLCPKEGRLVRRTKDGFTGVLDLGDAAIPFRTTDTSGTLSLQSGLLDWQAAKSASFDISARQMVLQMDIGDNTLGISAASPDLKLATANPLKITATTGRAEFSGSLVPADISLQSANFTATLPASGLSGRATANQVEVRDRGDDPLYRPFTGDLTANFGNGLMQVNGPISTARAGRTVADMNLTLDLVKMDGEASVTTRDLTFEPNGFQPTALSERVRGLLSNARGQLNAGASFLIDGGNVSGTGFVEATDLGFDTLRVGAVDGVNGRIVFDDIMALSTPPGQEVRLGSINPGIPLKDGVIHFKLTEATNATIEEARWPFAGGELVVGRSDWTISGTRDIIEISARKLELKDIISTFKLPDVEADGTVSGTFPVELVGPNAYIRNAVLKADSEGGKIAYTGEIGDAAAQADDRVELAFDALKDFRFSVLEVGADGNLSGDVLITLKLVGKSPKVLGGAPFAFNIGVDSELMKLIRTGQSMTSTGWLAEATAQSQTGAEVTEIESEPPEAAETPSP